MQSPDKDEIATQLLHDISVVLEEEYADSERELFPFLQPHYAYLRDMPLQQRILQALGFVDEGLRCVIKRGVTEALGRCATQWLGLWRGLEVFDLQQQLAPEALSSDVLSRLLRLQSVDHPDQRGIWLYQLLHRWKKAEIHPVIEIKDWMGVIRDMPVSALPEVLAYLFAGALQGNAGIEQCLELADNRLRDSRQLLSPDESEALRDKLHEIREAHLPSSDWRFGQSNDAIQIAPQTLLDQLDPSWNAQSPEQAKESAKLAHDAVEQEEDPEPAYA